MTNTSTARRIRRDHGAPAAPAQSEQQPRRESVRETLVDYDAGFVAALNLTGKTFYNATPHGTDDHGQPNQPYHQFNTGMMGFLIRVRDVPADFRPPADGRLVCNFKVVRVTDLNADGSTKRVTIAVTGKPVEAEPTHRVKATGNASGVMLNDGVQLCAIDNNTAVVLTPIAG